MKYGPKTRAFLSIAREWASIARGTSDPIAAAVAEARCSLAWSYVHRSIAGFVLVLVVLLQVTGCAAKDAAADVVPELAQYEIYRCGTFTGWKALMSVSCEGTDEMVGGHCEFTGGPPETESSPNDQTLECATTWDDSTKGGKICVHLVCGPRPKS